MAYRKLLIRPSEEVIRELYWCRRKSLRKVACELGCTHATIRYWMKKFGIPRRHRYLKPNITPSGNLAYILGVLKGDGCTYIRRTQKQVGWIQLTQTRLEFARSFEKALRGIGLHPYTISRSPTQPNRRTCYTTYANSIKFVKWYRGLTLEKIEKIVRRRRTFVKEFIRGFYESEGNNFIRRGHKKGWEISIVNKNRDLLSLVDLLLSDLGFDFHWGNTGIDGKYYRLRSSNSIQNYRFMREISPCIKNKTPRDGEGIKEAPRLERGSGRYS